MAFRVVGLELRIEGVTASIKNATQLQQAISKIDSALNRLGRGSPLRSELQKDYRNLIKLQDQFNKQANAGASANNTSFRGMNAQLQLLLTTYRGLTAEERKSSFGQRTLASIRQLRGEIDGLNRATGSGLLGNLRNGLSNIGNALTGGALLGGTAVVTRQLVQAISEAVDVTADFERQISFIGQILPDAFTISDDGTQVIERLRKEALRLGGVTEFTASQVAQLEIEYSKLGFTGTQTLGLLSATLDTATVSQEKLAETARTIGQTIRAFNLDITAGAKGSREELNQVIETGERVANVLAKAFASSALDLSKFATAVATVGAPAAAIGRSFEDVTASLGTLINAGFDASIAATSLRNIFIENSNIGAKYEDQLKKIREATDSLRKANELFGKRGAAAAVVLAFQQEETEKFADSLRETATATDKFASTAAAKIRGDLKGAFEAAEAAAERLRIELVSLAKVNINNVVRAFSQLLTLIASAASGDTAEATRSFLAIFNILGAGENTQLAALQIVQGLVNAFRQLNFAIAPVRIALRELGRAFGNLRRSVAKGANGLGTFSDAIEGVVFLLTTFVAIIAQGIALIIRWVTTAINWIASIEKVGIVLGATLAFIRNVIVALAALRAITLTTTVAMIAFRTTIAAITLITRAFAIALGIATAAQKGLNLATRRNALALLIAALITVIGRLSGATDSVKGFVQSLGGLASAAIEIGRIIGRVFTNIGNGFRLIYDGLFNVDIREGARQIAAGIAALTTAATSEFENFRQQVGQAYSKGFDEAGDFFENNLADVLNPELDAGGELLTGLEKFQAEVKDAIARFYAAVEAAAAEGNDVPIGLLKEFERELLALQNSPFLEQSGLADDIARVINDIGFSIEESFGVTINKLKAEKAKLLEEIGDLTFGSPRFKEIQKRLLEINKQLKLFTSSTSGSRTREKTFIEKQADDLKELERAIKKAIQEGKPYNDLLTQYLGIVKLINKANDEFKRKVELVATAAAAAEGSIRRLNTEMAILKFDLENATTQEARDGIIGDINKLKDALDEINRAQERLEVQRVDPQRTGVLDFDLQEDKNREEARASQLRKAARDTIRSEQQKALTIELINQNLALELNNIEKRKFREGSAAAVKLEEERKRILQESEQTISNLKLAVADDVNAELLAKEIRAAANRGESAARIQANIERQQLLARKQFLRNKLDIERLDQQEVLAILEELVEIECELLEQRNETVEEKNKKNFEQLGELANASLDVIANVLELQSQLIENQLQRQINAIERRYDQEVELAEGNAELIARAEQRKDRELERVQERAFKRQQRLQIALALIQGAQAVISTLAAPPGALDGVSFGILRALQVAAIVAATATQIASIRGQSFAEGGYTGPGEGKRDKSGHKPAGVVHAHEYVIPQKVLRTPEGASLAYHAEKLRRRQGLGSASASSSAGYVAGGFSNPGAIMPNIPVQAARRSNVGTTANVELTTESINAIIAGVERGTMNGSRMGAVEAEEERRRQERLNETTG